MTEYGAGAERAGEEAGGAGALLSIAAEEALQAAVYEGAAFNAIMTLASKVMWQHQRLSSSMPSLRKAAIMAVSSYPTRQLMLHYWLLHLLSHSFHLCC